METKKQGPMSEEVFNSSATSRREFLTTVGIGAAMGTLAVLKDPEAIRAQQIAQQEQLKGARVHMLKATPETCFWGFFDKTLPPVLKIRSGDIVYVETLTHQAGDAPDLLMDEGVKLVYDQITERGPGVHIMTGPIAVEEAEPGDTLEVRILGMTPRLPYGTNIAAHWGYLYKDFNTERITIYKFDVGTRLARAEFAFTYKTTPKYDRPGTITPPNPEARQKVLQGVVVPLRPHFGVMGVAPKESGKINSIPPGDFGGNIDNWRIGAGATMYSPIFNKGANFYMGDPHMAEGDGELSGTAIEASANGWVQIFVRKDFPITNPILETETHWITHGFNEDLNLAMRQAANQMLQFLVEKKKLSRDEAYSLMSVAVDFGITQVVDIRQGVHAAVPKNVFLPVLDTV
jgi:acetamidase/formamidase